MFLINLFWLCGDATNTLDLVPDVVTESNGGFVKYAFLIERLRGGEKILMNIIPLTSYWREKQ